MFNYRVVKEMGEIGIGVTRETDGGREMGEARNGASIHFVQDKLCAHMPPGRKRHMVPP